VQGIKVEKQELKGKLTLENISRKVKIARKESYPRSKFIRKNRVRKDFNKESHSISKIKIKSRNRKTFNKQGGINGIVIYLQKYIIKNGMLRIKMNIRFKQQKKLTIFRNETHTIRDKKHMLEALEYLFAKYYPDEFKNKQLAFQRTFNHYRLKYQYLLKKARECKRERDRRTKQGRKEEENLKELLQ